MVRIRMRRVGARNQPSYRIVAADKESPRDGRFLEAIGFYNPRTEPSTIQIDEARLFHWMEHGAQPSDSVLQALRSVGTWDRWERYKAGEKIETLLKEAEAAIPEVDPRTRRDDLFETRQNEKKASKKTEAEAETEETKDEAAAEAIEAEQAAEAEATESTAQVDADSTPEDDLKSEVEEEAEDRSDAGEVEAAQEPEEETPEQDEPGEEEPEQGESEAEESAAS